jgi:hypothetical protein
VLSVLDEALALASFNVRIIPNRHNSKIPAIEDWPKKASSDPEQIHKWFDKGDYNSGIVCGKVADKMWLVGVDIDNSPGKDGSNSILELADMGLELPPTWTQKTARDGFHRLYWSLVPIRQGVNVLGQGIDIRCEGGQLVGPGSIINGKRYEVINRMAFAFLPPWVQEGYSKAAPQAKVIDLHPKITVANQVLAMQRSIEHLQEQKPLSQGELNDGTLRAALKLKDIGLNQDQIPNTLSAHLKRDGDIDMETFKRITANAFKYGNNTPGVDAPEAVFDKIVPPKEVKKDYIDEFNDKYFYCPKAGVCEEMYNEGRFYLERYSVKVFHEKMLPESFWETKREIPIKFYKSSEWMESKRRREYKKIRFIPKSEVDKDTFNLWRGFKVKPSEIASDKGVDGFNKFIQHCRENICSNDEGSFEWLMNFLAHMFQKPWEKPPIAVVLSGEKGTGKNVFIDMLKHLIGPYAATISDNKVFTSPFNAVLEDKILVALDEAFWSGDRSVEGKLKSVITDGERWIERKGNEKYMADVYDRIFILGNEDKLVNATRDERRFAVFNVADTKKQNTAFFGEVIDGLKAGGDGLLMNYFTVRDISKFNFREAPNTQGLLDQKKQSLSEFEQWWLECLTEGRIIGAVDSGSGWPKTVQTKGLTEIYLCYEQENSRPRYPTSRFSIGKAFKKIAPSCSEQKSVRTSDTVRRAYEFCSLKKAREEWNAATKLNTEWE